MDCTVTAGDCADINTSKSKPCCDACPPTPACGTSAAPLCGAITLCDKTACGSSAAVTAAQPVTSTTAAPPCCSREAGNEPGACGNAVSNSQRILATASLSRVAVAVAAFSLLFCAAEGVVSVVLGNSSGSSLLLLFGVDSVVEVSSSAIVLWRMLGKGVPLERERRAVFVIGLLLVLLSIASYVKSVLSLINREEPESALPSLVIGAVSCTVMLITWRVKLYLSAKLRSPTLASDAVCSFSCAQMSGVVLISGVVFNVAPATWWIDAAATLLLAYYFMHEGRGMIKHARSKDFAGGCCCD